MDTDAGGRTIASVERACAIIDHLLEHEELGVSELADELDLTPGTVHCYLNTLREAGYVVKEDGRYRLGSRHVRLGEAVKNRIDGFDIVKSELEGIAAECGERVQFAVEERGKTVVIHQIIEEGAVESTFTTGEGEHLHCVAIGKAMLAYYPRDRVDEIVEEHGLPERGPNTITDRDALLEELDAIREQGYAVDDEELVRGVRCVAVPIRHGSGILGAISVSGPAGRMGRDRIEGELLDLLRGAANVVEVNSRIQTER